MSSFIEYDDGSTPISRSEDWAAHVGCGQSPGDVTTRWYGVLNRIEDPDGAGAILPPGVDYAVIVQDIDPEDPNHRLTQLVSDNQMTDEETSYVVTAYDDWAVGVAYAVGDVVNYNDKAYSCRQAHTSQSDWSPASAFTLWVIHRANEPELPWIACEPVEVGWTRVYDDILYECIQAHTTQSDWIPPNVPALWESQAPPTGEWQAWTPYTIGDLVTYQGSTYECRQSHTSQPGWEPPNVPALWLLV
jgi:chitodextrinase